MDRNMELYLHIPFCVKKCGYCDFLSFPADAGVQRRYVEALFREMEQWKEPCRGYEVSTVFVGGGTPSLLEAEWMAEIFDGIRQNFCLAGEAEITIEANPGTLTRKKLDIYKHAGINRLSLGLQSSDNRELAVLGRIHTWEQFLESYRLARESGFQNINVDLMSALPGQSMASWLCTLRRVTELEPEHISAYSLILEEGTPFYERYGHQEEKGNRVPDGLSLADGNEALSGISLPDEDTEREMYHRTEEFLKGCGYERYEISNYAKKGRECRHNTGYWTGVPYLGLGLGAASLWEGRRFSNVRELSGYLNGRTTDRDSLQILTEQDRQEEFFYLGLRMVRGVPLAQFEEQFRRQAEEIYSGVIQKHIRDGTVIVEDGCLRLTSLGMDVSNYVMADFLQG
ncbi:MAG: radical SAM family heme chaperone HemW [Lachnospiraceae bacterium]|jgi:oxygen-independent coproporphyrinogen-3 oxidase|nr:radical SAM family heme chaperone HemW [Lachnospiraceae bacterium]NBJ81126.1 radical SAM family heme chaperone HemW [bacterium 1XD42-76]NBK04335.1 radical SAM family heme chaperone HemW [bacterium 1XD42-94]